ncbi:MAG: PKD domain-containing protein [Candidatus Riflebacteria bacterium]|nr:PKD domain-containing protein [Candidatus Riflebacteria bacterium]
MKSKKWSVFFYLAAILILLPFLLSACSTATDGGFSDWEELIPKARTFRVSGKVDFSVQAISAGGYETLDRDMTGTEVYIDGYSSTCYAKTDEFGRFSIENVPEGYQSIIAIKHPKYSPPWIAKTETFPVFENTIDLKKVVELSPATVFRKMVIRDLLTASPLDATVNVWGMTKKAVGGKVTVGPAVADESAKEVRITAKGYKPLTGVLLFDGKAQAEVFVNLTPLGFANRAPIADIIASSTVMRAGESQELVASWLDADGDPVTWAWEFDGGELENPRRNRTRYTAPLQKGYYSITLRVADPAGASGSARLIIEVI